MDILAWVRHNCNVARVCWVLINREDTSSLDVLIKAEVHQHLSLPHQVEDTNLLSEVGDRGCQGCLWCRVGHPIIVCHHTFQGRGQVAKLKNRGLLPVNRVLGLEVGWLDSLSHDLSILD